MTIADDYYKVCPEELPEGLIDRVTKEVLPNDMTLVYKRGNVKGYCFHCGNFVKALPGTKFRQSEYTDCPVCGMRVNPTLETGSNWRRDYIANVATIQKAEDGSLWIRQWHLNRGSTRGVDERSFTEIARYCLVGIPAAGAKWLHENKDRWGLRIERYWCSEWTRNKKISDIYDGNDYLFFPEDFSEMVKGTCLEYYEPSSFFDGAGIRSLLDWGRYPALEKLYKAGYMQLVRDKLHYSGSKKIRWKQQTIEKALKLPLWVLKIKSPGEWSSQDIERMQQVYGMYERGLFRKEDIVPMAKWPYGLEYIERPLMFAGLPNVFKYTEKITGKAKYTWAGNSELMEWRDYLDMAEAMGMDLKNKRVLFPKDLKAEHDKLIARKKAKENKELSKAIKEASKKLERYDFSLGAMLIRPARSWNELFLEGQYNNHCVETYSRRMAEGRTAIFFVRKADDPDVPFYTLELRNKEVIQCRTKNNKSYVEDPDVKAFVDEWYSKKVARVKAAI